MTIYHLVDCDTIINCIGKQEYLLQKSDTFINIYYTVILIPNISLSTLAVPHTTILDMETYIIIKLLTNVSSFWFFIK